ncbi:MAG: hypothetical protein WA771_06745 [Chthoniobacterales bacterium]
MNVLVAFRRKIGSSAPINCRIGRRIVEAPPGVRAVGAEGVAVEEVADDLPDSVVEVAAEAEGEDAAALGDGSAGTAGGVG